MIGRASLLAGALAVLLASSAIALSWRNATTNADVADEIAARVLTEHFRACGRNIDRDAQLDAAAEFKAYDMGFRDRIAHQFNDGHRIWDFYAEAGIPRPYGAGEILAVSSFPDRDVARRIVNGWIDSPGHRALIRNCDYDRYGVAIFKTKSSSNCEADGSFCKKWAAVEFTNTQRP